jgi:hypothetical protein
MTGSPLVNQIRYWPIYRRCIDARYSRINERAVNCLVRPSFAAIAGEQSQAEKEI